MFQTPFQITCTVLSCCAVEILFHHDLLSPCDLDDVCNEEVKMQSQSVEVPVAEMVLYGLGNFSTCPIACYQFAFFMLMSECLKVSSFSLHENFFLLPLN